MDPQTIGLIILEALKLANNLIESTPLERRQVQMTQFLDFIEDAAKKADPKTWRIPDITIPSLDQMLKPPKP